jgi:hypothetical protein
MPLQVLKTGSPTMCSTGYTGPVIELNFDEHIQAGQGSITLHKRSLAAEDTSTPGCFDVHSSRMTPHRGTLNGLRINKDVVVSSGLYCADAHDIPFLVDGYPLEAPGGTDFCNHTGAILQNVPCCGKVCSTQPGYGYDVRYRWVQNTGQSGLTVLCSACPDASWIGCSTAASGRIVEISDPAKVLISENTVKIIDSDFTTDGWQYTLTMGAGVVKDISGNLFAGLHTSVGAAFHFRSRDTKAPEVKSGSIFPGAKGVSKDAGFKIFFDEDVKADILAASMCGY